MGKLIGRIPFLCSHFLARTFKNLLKYRAANSKVPNETFFDSFETLWDCTYNFWRLCPIHSFKVLSLSQDYPVQSQSVSKTSFGILLFEARYGRKYLNLRAKNGCIKNVILPTKRTAIQCYSQSKKPILPCFAIPFQFISQRKHNENAKQADFSWLEPF